jgi:hypothetical protein
MAARHSTAQRPRVRFKAAKDFPGYFVGSDGSVWSTWRRYYRKGAGRIGVAYRADGPWVRIKLRPTREGGYLDVELRRDRRSVHVLVHRLILIAFRGPPPTPYHECAHWDGSPSNNRLDNLRWATKSENQTDRWRHGTRLLGPRRHRA